MATADNRNNNSSARKRRSNFKKIRLVIFVPIAIVVVYFLAAIIVGIASNVSTTVALNGKISESFRASGYVFREAEVVNAPSGGFFECMVSEGEKVKKGQIVAYIYQNEPGSEQIAEIKKVIKEMRLTGADKDTRLYEGNAKGETVLSSLCRDLSDKRKEHNLTYAREKKEEIYIAADSKTENAEESKNRLVRLTNELTSLNSRLGSCVCIYAPSSGVFSSRIDGYEEKLSYSAADNLTVEYLESVESEEVSGQNTVEQGKPLCKIINNYKWRFGAVVDEKTAENITEGQNVTLRFFDVSNIEVKGTVQKITKGNGKCAIVINTNRYVDGIYSESKMNAEVVTMSVEGIKLPITALHVKDGETGVFVLRLGAAKFAPVNVKYQNDEWTIVSPSNDATGSSRLQIYDEVVTDGKNITEGKIIR